MAQVQEGLINEVRRERQIREVDKRVVRDFTTMSRPDKDALLLQLLQEAGYDIE